MNGLTVVSTSQERAFLSSFKEILMRNGGSQYPSITRTDLRIEIPLVASQGFYEVDILKSTGSGDRKLENKLQREHKFLATSIALNLQKQVPGSEANAPLFTHPDTNFFVVVGEAAALEPVYQGKIQFKSNQTLRSAEILTHRMRYCPAQGYQTAAAAGQALEHAQYGPTDAERGYVELINGLVFDGQESTKLTLTLGAGTTAAIQANTVAVVFISGYLYTGEEQNMGLVCS